MYSFLHSFLPFFLLFIIHLFIHQFICIWFIIFASYERQWHCCQDGTGDCEGDYGTVGPVVYLRPFIHSSILIPSIQVEPDVTFSLGDLVWSKLKGFDWWPGKVVSYLESRRSAPSPGHHWIKWFGDNKFSQVSTSKYIPTTTANFFRLFIKDKVFQWIICPSI